MPHLCFCWWWRRRYLILKYKIYWIEGAAQINDCLEHDSLQSYMQTHFFHSNPSHVCVCVLFVSFLNTEFPMVTPKVRKGHPIRIFHILCVHIVPTFSVRVYANVCQCVCVCLCMGRFDLENFFKKISS